MPRLALTVVCLVVIAPGPARSQAMSPEFAKALEEREAVALKRLASPQTWKSSPTAEAALQEELAFVKRTRLRAAAPVLVSHIAARSALAQPQQNYQTEFPALGALVAIGEPAVPLLIARLAEGPSEERLKTAPSEYDLLIFCLVEIGNVGGHGVEIARARVEAERAACVPEKRPFWDRVLKHRFLVNDTPPK